MTDQTRSRKSTRGWLALWIPAIPVLVTLLALSGCGSSLSSRYPALRDVDPTDGIGLYVDGSLAPVVYRQISEIESISGARMMPLYAPASSAEWLRHGVVLYYPGSEYGTDEFFEKIFGGTTKAAVHERLKSEPAYWSVTMVDGKALFLIAVADEDAWNSLRTQGKFRKDLRSFLRTVLGR